MPSSPATQYVTLALAERQLRKAQVPDGWELTPTRFQSALERSVAQRFAGSAPAAATIETFVESLQCRDLALAVACAAGNSAAWDHFVNQYRPELYRAARAIAGDSAGRELADSMYADLYGMRGSKDDRKSPLEYFLGRSKLSTWLHSVLSRKHVDEIRRTRKTESLDQSTGQDGSAKPLELPSRDTAVDPEREHYIALLQAVLSGVLIALPPRDRLRLAYYYVDELTLAEIGKLFGEHEATVSRKIERTRREVRGEVDTVLRQQKNLSEAQRSLCYEYARDEWPFDLSKALAVKE
ncbi:MAG: sigma-70 family RNA polymerase sigma factor [Candidatus Acidiferrales bacterium]